jgi:hypothetical protein
MNRDPTPRDLQLISDYLDNGLSAKEKERLEARLLHEPGLRAELESLQRTRTMLRSLPRRRVPRNFTLTPAMVPSRPALFLFPSFRLATALAGVLLVLALGSDLLLGGFGNRAMTLAESSRNAAPAAAPAQPNAILSQNQAQPGALEPTRAPLILWGSPKSGPGMGGGVGGGAGGAGEPATQPPAALSAPAEKVLDTSTQPPAIAPTQPPAEVLPEASITPTPEPQSSIMGLLPTPTPTLEPSSTHEPTQTQEPSPTPAATASPLPTEAPPPAATTPARVAISQDTQPGTGPILGVQPTTEAAIPPAADQIAASQAAEQQAPRLPLLHLVEALLALATVSCGAAAFYFYRKEHL